MFDPRLGLIYYSQKWVQEAIVKEAINKEVGVRIGDSFGKRPDTLKYNQDVMEFAKQHVTSFHLSEEIWHNPLQLSPEMQKKDLDTLRKGWDLVLDIDCPHWELSKTLAYSIIVTLQEHGIANVSVKFSGNKGFHIGVPFESFPTKVGTEPTSAWFPDGPRRIADYLMDYLAQKHVKVINGSLVFPGNKIFSIAELEEAFHKKLAEKRCTKCGKAYDKKQPSNEFVCPKCEHREVGDEAYKNCPKCTTFMEKTTNIIRCSCGSTTFEESFDPRSVIEVDTILISSRHLYRSSYSLHEKSGLVSLPMNPQKVLTFEKQTAQPAHVKNAEQVFLDRSKSKQGEANRLFREAFDYKPKIEQDEVATEKWDAPTEAIPEQFFPPCMHHIFRGIKDGKKRAVFILVNFLTMVGWDYDMIEKRLREWNKKNPEPLREQVLVSHIRYHKQQHKKVLPPNCDNQMYYVGIGVCHPDEFCKRIKNPVNYARLKARMQEQSKPKRRKKKAETETGPAAPNEPSPAPSQS
jgi:hypothetical protein